VIDLEDAIKEEMENKNIIESVNRQFVLKIIQ
jgi:hypothetical protein